MYTSIYQHQRLVISISNSSNVDNGDQSSAFISVRLQKLRLIDYPTLSLKLNKRLGNGSQESLDPDVLSPMSIVELMIYRLSLETGTGEWWTIFLDIWTYRLYNELWEYR